MPVDVVATYFRQSQYEAFFWWGMRANRDEIGTVHIVNDEPWPPEAHARHEILAEGIPFRLLDHPHEGYGVSRSMNQGISEATAEYCFLMSADQILRPDCLATIQRFAAPERMVIGNIDTILRDTSLEELPNPRILCGDESRRNVAHYKDMIRTWRYGRNGHTLVSREGHARVGGFNEAFVPLGYGIEDYEYAARWALEFGFDSIVFGDSKSWHFGDDLKTKLHREWKRPKQEAFVLLLRALESLYGRRYHLFHQNKMIFYRDAINVGQYGGMYLTTADVLLDCHNPSWLPDGSAEAIFIHYPNEDILTPQKLCEVLRRYVPKVRVGDSIRVYGNVPPEAVEDLGMDVEQTREYLELYREEE